MARPNSSTRGQRAAWLAICLTTVIGYREARAAECTPPTPACHLDHGKQLLASDPRRAADELLASYQLDERTDTLVLYATALQADHRYALALETWKRVIVFRESEIEAAKEAAKEAARTATGRKLAAARTAQARAQNQAEQAAEAIIKLWSSVGRVRIRFAAGQQLAVSHDGVEVDATHDVLVNAGRDELVFTRKDGSATRVPVEVAAGAVAKLDAPTEMVARPAAPTPPRPSRPVALAKPEAPPKPELPVPPKPEAPPKPDVAAKPEAPPTPPEPTLAAVQFTDQPRSRTMSRVGLGLVAGAAVAGGIAIGLGYVANRDFDRARELGCSGDGRCPFGPAADLAEQSNDRARLARITAIGGGALLATGVTLWIVGRSKTGRAADVALHISPSSAAIAGRF